jgi:hypothetical protein
MLPLLAPGLAVAELLTDRWKVAAIWRAYMRTCDTLWDDAGLRFAEAKDGDGRDMLPKHPREDDTRWKARRAACTPTAYARQITDHYLSHITRQTPVRKAEGLDTIPDGWAVMVADADAVGTPLAEIVKQAGRFAFLESDGFLLLDWIAPANAVSAADQSGARGVVRAVPADDVLAVTLTSGNIVVSAIVRLPGPDGVPFLWRVDATTCQRASLNAKGDVVTSADAPIPHRYGGCPLVRVGPMPSIMPAVAEYQKAIAVNDSFLRYRMGEDAIPWLVVTGTANAQAFVDALQSNPAFSAFEDKDAKAIHIGASVEVAKSLREAIDDDEERLYRVAKVRPVSAQSGNPESGVAHAYRFVDADVELATVASAMERAENRIASLWATATGLGTPVVATYPRTFVPVDRQAELTSLQQTSASTLPEPIKAREYQRSAATLYPDDKDLLQELEDTRQADPGTDDGASNSDDKRQVPT